jgi:hypothetical protein
MSLVFQELNFLVENRNVLGVCVCVCVCVCVQFSWWGGHSSRRTFVKPDIHQGGHLSSRTFVKADICQAGHSSRQTFINYKHFCQLNGLIKSLNQIPRISWPMSALTNICLDKWPPWQMSALTNVCIDKCPPWQMSALTNVRLVECPPHPLALLIDIRLGWKCLPASNALAYHAKL